MENPTLPSFHLSNSSTLNVLLNVNKNIVGTFDLQKNLIETVHGADRQGVSEHEW